MKQARANMPMPPANRALASTRVLAASSKEKMDKQGSKFTIKVKATTSASHEGSRFASAISYNATIEAMKIRTNFERPLGFYATGDNSPMKKFATSTLILLAASLTAFAASIDGKWTSE